MSAISSTDRRQQKTRQAILGAFTSLMFERSYAAVTVADVAARANVGRSTLYEHFRTKADLLREGLSVPFGALAAVAMPGDAPHLPDLLQHFRDNQALGRVLFAMPTRDILHRTLAQQIEKRLNPGDAFIIPRSLVACQIAAAQLALLAPWTLGQVAVPSTAMADALCRGSRAIVEALRVPGN